MDNVATCNTAAGKPVTASAPLPVRFPFTYADDLVVCCCSVTQDTLADSLSALLAHPSYGVRFEAAVALASLGSALPWCAAGLLQQVGTVAVAEAEAEAEI